MGSEMCIRDRDYTAKPCRGNARDLLKIVIILENSLISVKHNELVSSLFDFQFRANIDIGLSG